MRRILLALSMLVSTPMVFADLIENNSSEQLGKLSHTISAGSYSADTPREKSTHLNVTVRQQNNKTVKAASSTATEFTNASITQKYGQSATGGVMSWLKKNPLPDAVRLSSGFGQRVMGGKREGHPGVDLAAPSGTPIFASGTGVVTRSGWVNGYGQFVEINHGNGYLTRYGHASRLFVKVGDKVSAGEEIAKVGCTGRCTGPHLHYEIVADGKRANPSTYLAMLP
ncbi:M23 family metallopeptidase [Acinetobacter sp. HY1485]|uniref:M23 family metallopeptidase n=1 Tax=Acinetobacter sp. HY1485 TaxID=2970918 RepID=UPI0022B94F3A|nr:M23 family metallopeptidase [Acinetobacter sp. HY1485]